MNYCKECELHELDCVCLELEDCQKALDSFTWTYKALCTSERCSKTDIGVEKNVGRSENVCPDCGDYLFWERKVG